MDLQSGIVDSLPGVEPLLDRSVAALARPAPAG